MRALLRLRLAHERRPLPRHRPLRLRPRRFRDGSGEIQEQTSFRSRQGLRSKNPRAGAAQQVELRGSHRTQGLHDHRPRRHRLPGFLPDALEEWLLRLVRCRAGREIRRHGNPAQSQRGRQHEISRRRNRQPGGRRQSLKTPSWSCGSERRAASSRTGRRLSLAEVEQLRLLPEALRFVGGIYCADDEPNESSILCPGLEADQQNETEYESKTGYKRINKKIAVSNRFL